jgi:hypothetical protein
MKDFKYSFNEVSAVKEEAVILAKKVDIIKPVEVKTPQIEKNIEAKTEGISDKSNEKSTDVIYAQKIENGYQLVNLKPEILFLIFKTNKADVYVIKDKNGIFYKTNNGWIAEYYENNKLIQKKFQVNF